MTALLVSWLHRSSRKRGPHIFPLFCGIFGLVLTASCYRESSAPNPQTAERLLIALLSDRDTALRRTAAEALGKIGARDAVPPLVRALQDQEPAVRAAAARSLGQIAPFDADAASEVVRLTQDSDYSVRRAAAQALGQAENPASFTSTLADLALHSSPDGRRAALHALMLIDGPDVLGALTKTIHDIDPDLRQKAVTALAELGDAHVLPILEDRLLRDDAPDVRAEAAYRLGLVGNESTLAVLDHAAAQDRSASVRRWAQRSREGIRKGFGSG